MSDLAHDRALELVKKHESSNFNEADTRHKIIDEVIHSILSFPKELVACESFINPGYADYRLKKANGDDLLFIEAKKKNKYFALPKNFNNDSLATHIMLKTLLTDNNIKNAIEQVRAYCVDEGCEFACITNGQVWIFFKVFEKGKNWKNLRAFVVKKLNYFAVSFIDAINKLGYSSIIDGSLRDLVGSFSRHYREIYYPREKVTSYKKKVGSNKYVSQIRKLANRNFGIIDVNDYEFMNHCYVSESDYDQAFTDFRQIIKDTLSPYFEDYGIQSLENNKTGGKLGSRIKKSLREIKEGEVLILFGGKGAGKSTFINRLFFHEPPQYIDKHAQIAIVDLLKVPEQKDTVYNTIWEQIILALDGEKILNSERSKLLEVFNDKFLVAKSQDLFGIDENSESYNIRLNELVKEWKNDVKYCASRLVAFGKRKKRNSIIVIDNTDQYSLEIQDFCFSTAQEISSLLDCLVIISMREERFYASNIHGTLDAYQNSGFHISSPVTSSVFKKRISYVIDKLLGQEQVEMVYYEDADVKHIPVFQKLFGMLLHEFEKGDHSPLCEFLTACSHGNTRMALDLFRDFLQSGYTNIDEWVSVDKFWTLKIHQVLKPFMIPYRFFYDEKQSKIPNIYQIRSKLNGSHFTSIRILKHLCEGLDKNNLSYTSINELKEYFIDTFNMSEDFEKNMDILLKYNFVESNNRIDYYCEDVDSIRATTYGLYIYNRLSSYFTYIDLISTDCGYFDEETANQIVALSNKDLKLYSERKRQSRIQTRLKKAENFIKYLIKEEEKENELYNLKPISSIASGMLENFLVEKDAVLKSANNQRNK